MTGIMYVFDQEGHIMLPLLEVLKVDGGGEFIFFFFSGAATNKLILQLYTLGQVILIELAK